MIKVWVCVVLVSIIWFVQASTEVFQWVKQVGGTYSNYGRGCAVAGDGSVYVTGSFSGTATIASTTLNSRNSDIIVIKYSIEGQIQWVRQAGGADIDAGMGIVVAIDGSVYITGSFSGTATFGTLNITSVGGFDMFIAKYSSDGQIQWVQRGGSASVDIGRSLSVASDGSVYVTGSFSDTATFGSTILSYSGSVFDIFIVKYSSDGQIQWAKRAGSQNSDYAQSIVVSSDGSVYITGYFFGVLGFDSLSVTSADSVNIFIAKYSSVGNVQWVKGAGGTGNDNGMSIAVSNTGSAYVTGSFSGTATFGTLSVTSTGGSDMVVIKYSSSGQVQWARRAGGTGDDEGRSITVSSDGSVYVTGVFSGTATFDTLSVASAGYYDVFIAKYSSDGQIQWVKRAGGASYDYGLSIVVSEDGSVHVAGYVPSGTATFGALSVTTSSASDIFITKIHSESWYTCFSIGYNSSSVCSGK